MVIIEIQRLATLRAVFMQSFCYVSPLQAVSSMGPYIVSVLSAGVGIPLPPVVGRTMSPKTPVLYVTPGPVDVLSYLAKGLCGCDQVKKPEMERFSWIIQSLQTALEGQQGSAGGSITRGLTQCRVGVRPGSPERFRFKMRLEG